MTLAARANRLREMEKLRRRYINAYAAANGREPEIAYVNGWFRIRGVGSFFANFRAHDVQNMARQLERRIAK